MTTQAQIDSLKTSYAQLGLLIGQLAPDAPTPAPVPQPAGELWTAFQSAFLGTKKYQPVAVDASGKPLTPIVPGSGYSSTYVDATHGLVTWGTAIEHHAIVAGPGGELWALVEGYGSTTDASILYPEEVVKCDWTNLDTGLVRDMSSFTAGPVGGIMCPLQLPASGRYRLRQWGWVWNSRQGARVRPFYWQCDYEFGLQIANPAWTQDAQTTRLAIKYAEAWWDRDAGWLPDLLIGTPPTPWNGDQPVEIPPLIYAGYRAFGKGAGTLWRNDFPAYRVSLASAN